LNDGSSVDADAVVFCTGYSFNFPFLDAECRVSVESHQGPVF
jgi:hypothetical protein